MKQELGCVGGCAEASVAAAAAGNERLVAVRPGIVFEERMLRPELGGVYRNLLEILGWPESATSSCLGCFEQIPVGDDRSGDAECKSE